MDFFKLFQGMTSPSLPIARTTLDNGVIVSTVDTPDQGPETAIIDSNGAHPVERYESVQAAEIGHAKWSAKAANFSNGDKITMLGYGGLVDPEEVTLQL